MPRSPYKLDWYYRDDIQNALDIIVPTVGMALTFFVVRWFFTH